MPLSTTSELNALYNDIFADSLMALREENLMVGGGLVTPYNGTGYADRKVGVWNKSAVSIKPEGVDYANPTKMEKTLLATFSPQVRFSQYILTDEMKSTDSVDNVRNAATQELASGLAEQIDLDIMAKFASFSASKGSAGSALTIARTAAAISTLRGEKVRGARYGVLHPFQWHDLWTELGQPVVNQALLGDIANEALRSFYVSDWMACRWFISANIEPNSNDDAYGAVFTRDALAYDQREAFTLEPQRDASLKGEELNASIGYAVGILRNEAGVSILSDASEPTG